MDHVLPDNRREWDRRMERAERTRRRRRATVLTTVVAFGALLAAAGLGLTARSLFPATAASEQTQELQIGALVTRPAWLSTGTIITMPGPVAASTGPAPARTAAASHPRPAHPKKVAGRIAHHLAAGNTEVARHVIPSEIARRTGCRIGVASATVDPADDEQVQAEKSARTRRLRSAREALGRRAVAHASVDDARGRSVHVIVMHQCPEPAP